MGTLCPKEVAVLEVVLLVVAVHAAAAVGGEVADCEGTADDGVAVEWAAADEVDDMAVVAVVLVVLVVADDAFLELLKENEANK